MARAPKRAADIGLNAISVEGALIAPEQLIVIAATTPDAKTAADYNCPKGTNLRDEITRYFRIGQAHWRAYSLIAAPTITQTAAFADILLTQAFGFEALAGPADHEKEDRHYRIAREAKGGRVPIVVAAPLPGGDAFTGPRELRQVLLKRKDRFAENLAEQFITSATSAEESGQEAFDSEVTEESGGPFVRSSGAKEYARTSEAPNIPEAEREPFPSPMRTGRR